jgi:hypothetical protein
MLYETAHTLARIFLEQGREPFMLALFETSKKQKLSSYQVSNLKAEIKKILIEYHEIIQEGASDENINEAFERR